MAGTKLLTQLCFVCSLLAVVPVAYRFSAIERQPLPHSALKAVPADIEDSLIELALATTAAGGSAGLDLRQEVRRLRAMQSFRPAAQLRLSVTFVTADAAHPALDGADVLQEMDDMQTEISTIAAKFAEVVPTHLVFQVQTVDMSKMRGPVAATTTTTKAANAQTRNVYVVGLPQVQKYTRASRSAVQTGGRELQLFVIRPPSGEIWDVESHNGERLDRAHIGNRTLIAGYWSPSEGLYLIANHGPDTAAKAAKFLSDNLLQVYGIRANTESGSTVVQQVAYALDMYSSALDALQATYMLVEDTPYMTVTKDIAERFRRAVDLLLSVSEQARPFSDTFEAIRQAYEIAQSIHYDRSMLPTMYFPLDQLFAVYAPLWLPLLAPVVVGTVTQVKKYWQSKRKQEQQQLLEQR